MIAICLLALQSANLLSPAQTREGWKLLFDGKTTAGWRGYHQEKIGEGWVVKDGNLVLADYTKGGDIMTTEKYQWFELVLDFNLGKGQNSGIMYHVVAGGEAPWHSGPEIQLYDHPVQDGVETTGYLYQLYASKKDAAKPAGQWNQMRIVVAPDKCFTEVNGVRYHEYVYGSADFRARIAKSKFSEFPEFAKAGNGYIAIQGDHGNVMFRNMKIRPIKK